LHGAFSLPGVTDASHETGPAEQLAAAIDACRAALADYEAGLLTDAELRQGLFRAGLVQGAGEAWMLDLERGTWQRYDGVSLTEPSFRVHSTQLARWRDTLERVRAEVAEPVHRTPFHGEVQG
jgi:hypothetical protein